jgi:hypothetical protein
MIYLIFIFCFKYLFVCIIMHAYKNIKLVKLSFFIKTWSWKCLILRIHVSKLSFLFIFLFLWIHIWINLFKFVNSNSFIITTML